MMEVSEFLRFRDRLRYSAATGRVAEDGVVAVLRTIP